MKYLGIDYGSKKIGLAISDERGSIAFPKKIIKNNKSSLEEIKNICLKENIGAIVIGESLNYRGDYNKIMEKILLFKENLKKFIKLPVYFQKEFFTTFESSFKVKETKIKNKREIDDIAAALILQRFLDKINREKIK